MLRPPWTIPEVRGVTALETNGKAVAVAKIPDAPGLPPHSQAPPPDAGPALQSHVPSKSQKLLLEMNELQQSDTQCMWPTW